MKTPVNLFVLDLDDTLFLERDYVRSGFSAVGTWLRENMGLKGFSDTAWQLFENGCRGDIFNRALAAYGFGNRDLLGRLVQIYRSHKPDLHLLPDAEYFLRSKNKDDLALITDGHPESQWAKINALGLPSLIGRIFVTGDWGKEFSKPHPRAFVAAAGGRQPSECQYIGDNPEKDFISPQKLGWATSVRIRQPGSLHFKIPTPSFLIEISSFIEA